MSENRRHIDATPAQLWGVISDPYSYADWVVGAKEIRGVEGRWPKPGSKLKHTVGAGPASIKDETVVVDVAACERIVLRGRFRPVGVANITLQLEPKDAGTDVVMTEEVVGGWAAKLRGRAMNIALKGRNSETLRRLEKLTRQ